MSDQLRQLGIDLIEGFDAAQLSLKPDLYVVGNVVSRGNALMEAILNAGAPYTSGPQWLAEHVLQGRHVLAVAGTHGKTTTTSMLAWVLEQAGLQPGFLVGGVPANFGVSARLGRLASTTPAARESSPFESSPFVIEADEYDTAFFDKRSKFVHYRPRTALLNNLEFDHADIFTNLEAIETQFHHLVRTVPSAGLLVVNGRDEALQRVLARGAWAPVQRFGALREEPGSLRARGEPHDFDVLRSGTRVGHIAWGLLGEHNQMNALAAVAAAEHVGVKPDVACKALSQFDGVKRRLELRGEVGGVKVYDDFAHHPTAIRLTLDGMRRRTPEARLLAVFEPRSNTMKLGAMKAQLPWSLGACDLAFCHAANLGWDPAEALRPMEEKAKTFVDIDTLVQALVKAARPGDHVVCMSNGGFGGIHDKLLKALAAR
jgi:UDP-N-acetylmuramate: L-alanyl-gamma-D-glutamyl-meso-diaminopimelate ligase